MLFFQIALLAVGLVLTIAVLMQHGKSYGLSGTIAGGESGILVLDQTPFYGEMGGEVGDQGELVNEAETIRVLDTKKENGVSVHIVDRIPADPTAEFMACVDVDMRRAVEANHTCTHLIDEALREVLAEALQKRLNE